MAAILNFFFVVHYCWFDLLCKNYSNPISSFYSKKVFIVKKICINIYGKNRCMCAPRTYTFFNKMVMEFRLNHSFRQYSSFHIFSIFYLFSHLLQHHNSKIKVSQKLHWKFKYHVIYYTYLNDIILSFFAKLWKKLVLNCTNLVSF